MKKCNSCGVIKPLSAYYFARGSPIHKCKPCWSAYVYAKQKGRRKKRNVEKSAAYSRRWYEKNKDRLKAKALQWAKDNKERCAAKARNRLALASRSVGTHTADEIRALYERQRGRCAACRVDISSGYHADHIVALKNGGLNSIGNIQLLCRTCNLRKGAKDPVVFMQQMGFLI